MRKFTIRCRPDLPEFYSFEDGVGFTIWESYLGQIESGLTVWTSGIDPANAFYSRAELYDAWWDEAMSLLEDEGQDDVLVENDPFDGSPHWRIGDRRYDVISVLDHPQGRRHV